MVGLGRRGDEGEAGEERSVGDVKDGEERPVGPGTVGLGCAGTRGQG